MEAGSGSKLQQLEELGPLLSHEPGGPRALNHPENSPTRLSREDASELYRNASLLELATMASVVRQRLNPGKTVSFLVDRNINYTNVCNTDCSFCGFYRRDPAHPEAYVLSREILGRKIEEALKLGATRILLQGGHNDQLPYSFYPELVAWIHATYPIEINAFSPSEIEQMERVSGKTALEILKELKAAGLRGLPGGGAEILDDSVRQRVSPKKIKTQRWLDIMEDAQSLNLTTTVTMVFGFGEDFETRLNHLERVRNVQDAAIERGRRGFNAFVCWPLQHNENTSLGRSRLKEKYGASAMEYLRMISIARLYLDNVPHVQASWPTLGIEIAQVALQYGCDDIGSTMMEENVVSQAGAKSKDTWSLSPQELCEAISDAGFIPAQRNSSFELLRTFE